MTGSKRVLYGAWLYWSAIPVALVCIGYSVLGAYSTREREHMDLFLAAFTKNLKLLGISHISPSISGSLPEIFYVNLFGICVWGVLLHTICTVFFAVKGIFPFRRRPIPLEDTMRARNLSAERAWTLLKIRTLLATALFLILLIPIFLNGIFGWIVYQVGTKDWFVTCLSVFIFFYLPGAFISPLIVTLFRLPCLRAENLSESHHSVETPS